MKHPRQKPPAQADLCPCCGYHDRKHAWDHIAGCPDKSTGIYHFHR
jgi:hypothetical protein